MNKVIHTPTPLHYLTVSVYCIYKRLVTPSYLKKMKLYTFLDANENVIEEVRAEDHFDAVSRANGWRAEGDKRELVTYDTDFYSEESIDSIRN